MRSRTSQNLEKLRYPVVVSFTTYSRHRWFVAGPDAPEKMSCLRLQRLLTLAVKTFACPLGGPCDRRQILSDMWVCKTPVVEVSRTCAQGMKLRRRHLWPACAVVRDPSTELCTAHYSAVLLPLITRLRRDSRLKRCGVRFA